MISFELLRELIGQLETFESEQDADHSSMHDFIRFLNKQPVVKSSANDKRFGQQAQDAQQLAAEVENTIARLITYMNRYSRYYIKKALEGTAIQGPEEFSYLALLLTHGNITKSELIHLNMQEKTTGTEILRRLLSAGLINQEEDKNDKRIKRVSISEIGKGLLYSVFKDMANVSKMLTGNLNLIEKETLRDILLKLEDFHHPIFENKAVASKKDINEWVNKL
jgi:DNA-binding MarR family transcriptional regulator